MTVNGIIFDMGWTLLDFPGAIASTEPQRAQDVRDFLLDSGFDVDGTALFASYSEELLALWRVGRPLDYEYPARLAMLRALRRYLKRQDATRLAAGALAASFDCIVPQWQLYPDTVSTLATLRDAGYRLGCVSNTSDSAHVWLMVDRCGLRPWLSPFYTSEDLGLRKPDAAVFHRVMDDWGLPPEEVIMVGDTLNADVLGAHNAGMRGIWVDRGLVNPWSNNEANKNHIFPDATIKQLGELASLLTDW